MAEQCMVMSDPLVKKLHEVVDPIVAHSFFNRHNGDIEFIKDMSKDDIKTYIHDKMSHNRTHTIPLHHIREGLLNQLKKLNHSTANNKAFRQKQVERQLKKLDDVDTITSIAEIVDYMYDEAIGEEIEVDRAGTKVKSRTGWIGTLDNFIHGINKEVEGIDKLTPDKKQEKLALVMKQLQSFFDYAGTLDFLNEYEDIYKDSLAANVVAEEGSTLDKIKKLVSERDSIKRQYNTTILPIMAKILLPYANDNTNKAHFNKYEMMLKRIERDKKLGKDTKEAEKKARKFLDEHYVTEDTLLKNLREIHKDLSWIDKSYSPMISLGDFTLSLFAKFVKSGYNDARLDLADFKFELQKEYETLVKAKGGQNSPHKLNEGIYEVVTSYRINEEGEIEERRHNSFVKDWDESEYNKKRLEQRKLAESLSDKKAASSWVEWYETYHEPLPMDDYDEFGIEKKGIKSIIEKMKDNVSKGIITSEDFQDWIYENMKNEDVWFSSSTQDDVNKEYITDKESYARHMLILFGNNPDAITYTRELSQPKKSEFPNANWNKLQANSINKEFHDKMVRRYFKSQLRYHEDQRMGYVLPYRYKTGNERVAEGKVVGAIKNNIKDTVRVRKDSTNTYGQGDNVLPIYYREYIPAEESSVDIFESILNYEKASRLYEAAGEMEPVTNAFRAILKDRVVLKDNGKGDGIIDGFAKKYGLEKYLPQDGISNASEMVDLFIEQQIYGKMSAEETISVPFVGKVDVGHMMSKLMGFASLSMLGGPELLKSTANWLQAATQKLLESTAKEFVNVGDLAYGEKTFLGEMKNVLTDWSKPMSTSLAGQWLDMVDFIQGDFIDEYGNNVSGNALKKASTSGSYMFMNNAAEYQTQASFAFSLANTIKLKDVNGNEINYFQAYELGNNGRIKLKDGVTKLDGSEWTKKDSEDFMNRLHAINKRLHGVYNSFDRAVAKKWTIHKLILMFKGFLLPTVKKRYKVYGGDHELGGATEGFYRTLVRLAVKERGELIKYLMRKEALLTPEEKANVRRAIAEISLVILLSVAATFVKGLGDDDEELKKNYAYNLALYELTRLSSELRFYVPGIGGKDQLRLVTAPTAFNSFAERGWKLTAQTFGYTSDDGWAIDDVYKRDSGWNKKGDSKFKARVLTMLGYNGNNVNPAQAVEIFHKL